MVIFVQNSGYKRCSGSPAGYAVGGGALSGRAGTEPLPLRSPVFFGLRQMSKPTSIYPGTRTRQRSDKAPHTQNHNPSPGGPLAVRKGCQLPIDVSGEKTIDFFTMQGSDKSYRVFFYGHSNAIITCSDPIV